MVQHLRRMPHAFFQFHLLKFSRKNLSHEALFIKGRKDRGKNLRKSVIKGRRVNVF